MNWYKKATALDGGCIDGWTDSQLGHFVVFRLGNRYYKYKLSFPDWVEDVKRMSRYTPKKALDFVEQRASEAWEVEGRNWREPSAAFREVDLGELRERSRERDDRERDDREVQGLLDI